MNRTPATSLNGRQEGTAPRSQANPPIRVLVADDHAVLRQALRYMLESQQGLEVVGEAQTAARRSTWPRSSTRTSSSWTR